ncbi:MAG: phosphoribosylpyrophosphate synthetase [bacterium]|nr:phosphoribosylpyrophosphate synthetase [bacterium]
MINPEPTLSETLKVLKAQGYTEDFNLKADCIDCRSGHLKIFPSDFQVDQYFRFEGQTDPADQAVLYAISSEKHKIKGVLVNAYGVYSDPLTDELLAKLKIN